MTLNQLEYFCAVCRYHSITRAAEVLFVSQPTISVAIRELEKEFHLRLFTHGRNRITLTDDGAAFYKKAEHILSQTHDMYTEFSTGSGENRHPLKIGIPPMLSTVFFPRLMDLFHEQYDIPVRLYEYGSTRACSLVDSEELDIAMVNMDFYNTDKYNSHVMLTDHYVYCVSKTHRLADKSEISFDMLEKEPVILFNTDSVQNHTVMARFRSADVMPNVVMHASQLYTTLNYVRGGDCGAFLYSCLPVNPRDFVSIPLAPEITVRSGIVWKKGIFIPDRLSKFITFMKDVDSGIFLHGPC